MMAPSLSPEQCRHLAARGPCAAILALKGAESPYLRDCLVRHYQHQTYAMLAADLGADPSAEAFTIVAGIGTLVLRPGGTQFSSAIPDTATAVSNVPPSPQRFPDAPLEAPPAVADQRRQRCQCCARWSHGRCQVAGCACAGLGQPDRLFSRCPEGRW